MTTRHRKHRHRRHGSEDGLERRGHSAQHRRLLAVLAIAACAYGSANLLISTLRPRLSGSDGVVLQRAGAGDDPAAAAAFSAPPPGDDADAAPLPPAVTECGPDAGRVADDLLAYWLARTDSHLRRLRARRIGPNALRSPNTSALLMDLGLAVDSDLCYAKFVFRRGVVSMDDAFARHCNSAGLAQACKERAELYSGAFTHVAARHAAEAAAWPDFAFYMDLTAGSRSNDELREALELPTLAPGASPNDASALLVPDPYLLMAVLEKEGKGDVIPGPLREAAKGLVAEYWGRPVAWDQKLSQAVFRGSCFPTIDSNNPRPHTRVMMRSELCDRLGAQASLFDIGTYTRGIGDSPCTPPGGDALAWCQQCNKCSSARRLTHDFMINTYKYQLLVDGQGPGYDATLWKLMSGSTCFQVTPDDTGGRPLWSMFYFPLLQPGVHYIPAPLSGLAQAVARCRDNDEDCAKVAAAARARGECLLRPGVALGYLWGVLKRVHAFHFIDKAPQEW